jgi:hypothetical protein
MVAQHEEGLCFGVWRPPTFRMLRSMPQGMRLEARSTVVLSGISDES